MNRFVLAAAAALALFACPKPAPTTNLGGSDDEKMDTIASKLEEYRTRTDLTCDDNCSLKVKVCDLSNTACDIAGKHSDRNEFQKRCIAAQEECAKFNEACSGCQQ